MKLKISKKMMVIIICVAAVIFISAAVLGYFYYYNGVDLKLTEYQVISKYYESCILRARVIDSKEDELLMEDWYGISIKDGVDYDQYSLIISESEQIDKFVMYVFWNPHTIPRGRDTKQVAICEPEFGEERHNTLLFYLVKQKNIVSCTEYERTFF